MGLGPGTGVANKGQIVCLGQYLRCAEGHTLPGGRVSVGSVRTGPFPRGPEQSDKSESYVHYYLRSDLGQGWASLPQLLNWKKGRRRVWFPYQRGEAGTRVSF